MRKDATIILVVRPLDPAYRKKSSGHANRVAGIVNRVSRILHLDDAAPVAIAKLETTREGHDLGLRELVFQDPPGVTDRLGPAGASPAHNVFCVPPVPGDTDRAFNHLHGLAVEVVRIVPRYPDYRISVSNVGANIAEPSVINIGG